MALLYVATLTCEGKWPSLLVHAVEVETSVSKQKYKKQKGMIEAHESTIHKLLESIKNSEEKEKVTKLDKELALEKENG